MQATNVEKIEFVEFDDDAVPMILDIIGKEINEEGKVFDKNIQEIEEDQYSHNEITETNLGGILVGSKVLVTKDIASFAEHITKYCE